MTTSILSLLALNLIRSLRARQKLLTVEGRERFVAVEEELRAHLTGVGAYVSALVYGVIFALVGLP